MRQPRRNLIRPAPGGVKKRGAYTAHLPTSSRNSSVRRPTKSTSNKVLKAWETALIDRVAWAYDEMNYNYNRSNVALLEDALTETQVLINHYRKTGKRGIVLAVFSGKGRISSSPVLGRYDSAPVGRWDPVSVKQIREHATELEERHMENLADGVIDLVYNGMWNDDAVLDHDYVIPYVSLYWFKKKHPIPPRLQRQFNRVSRWIKERTPQFVIDNTSAADLDNNPAPLRRIKRGAALLLRRRPNKRRRNETNVRQPKKTA